MDDGRLVRNVTIRWGRRPAGYVLLVVLVVLVVLAALVASLGTRLTMAKRRQQYMIEYQRARYGLDSAMKYILSEVPKMNFKVQGREGQPDFSDLFWMDQASYCQMIADWAGEATEEQIEAAMKEGASLYESEPVDVGSLMSRLSSLFGGSGDEPNAMTTLGAMPDADLTGPDEDMVYMELDPNDIAVAGPYGVEWPQVIEPIDFEVGTCKVMITIEDENAKLPLSWLVRAYDKDTDKDSVSPTVYALQTFLEWMADTTQESWEIADLEAQLKEDLKTISEKKRFQLNPSAILIKSTRSTGATRYRTVRSRDPKTGKITTQRIPISGSSSTTTSQQRPAIAHTTDFAKLFHSSLIDQDRLNLPLADRGAADREETMLKYIGLWGSQRVNVNTAPRHILEATFVMAMSSSEAVKMAQAVIVQRQTEPFTKIEDIKEAGMLDTDTFNNLRNYITTTSTFFKIRGVSRSGNAMATAVAAVVKEGSKAETLVVLYNQ